MRKFYLGFALTTSIIGGAIFAADPTSTKTTSVSVYSQRSSNSEASKSIVAGTLIADEEVKPVVKSKGFFERLFGQETTPVSYEEQLPSSMPTMPTMPAVPAVPAASIPQAATPELLPATSAPVLDRMNHSTSPTVPAPQLLPGVDCGPTCGSPLFGGSSSLLQGGCKTDVCQSPGRGSLFGGFLTRPLGLFSCNTGDCSTGGCNTTQSCGNNPLQARVGSHPVVNTSWQKFKSWITFQPCEGPRASLFSPEPYTSKSIYFWSGPSKNYGSCYSNASCGTCRSPKALDMPGANCNSTSCGSACGENASGIGLLSGALAGKCRRGPQDCNAEPKLQNTQFSPGYRFAGDQLKSGTNYQSKMNIDAVSGTIHVVENNPITYERTANQQPAVKIKSTVPSSIEPVKGINGTAVSRTKPATEKDVLKVPFSQQ